MNYKEYKKVYDDFLYAEKKLFKIVHKEIIDLAKNIAKEWNKIFNLVGKDLNKDNHIKIDIESPSSFVCINWGYYCSDHYNPMEFDEEDIWGIKYMFCNQYLRIPIKDIFDKEKLIDEWNKNKKALDARKLKIETAKKNKDKQQELDEIEERNRLYLKLKKEFEGNKNE